MSRAELRVALMKKTGWSQQTLSNRVKALRRLTPISTEVGQAVLAQQAGLRVDKHLTADQVAETQRVIGLLHAAPAATPRIQLSPPRSAGTKSAANRTRAASSSRRIVFSDRFEYADSILPVLKVKEAREMAAIYPMLYVLENSMRELIDRVMTANHGADWWTTALESPGTARNARKHADDRRATEDTRLRWHQRRGARPIDYADFSDLGDIIRAKQSDFVPMVLGENLDWFNGLMRELEPTRNVVCHMNPLDASHIDNLKGKLGMWHNIVDRWSRDSAA